MRPRRLLGRVYRALRRRICEARIPGLVRALQRTPPSRQAIMPVVARLRDAWGNTSYSADLGYLEEVVERTLRSSGPFLECGAGLSTVVLGALTKRNRTVIWSLEQDAQWAATMRNRIAALGFDRVHVVHAPLEVLPDGDMWYAFDCGSMPRRFATVFCDGPAVRKSQWPPHIYLAWRSPVVSELQRRQIAFDEIVLDDEEDQRCERLLASWHRSGLQTDVVVTPFGRHVVATWPRPL